MLRRAQHWTDSPVAGRQRRRTIGNWLNYRTPGNGWAPSVPGVSLAASSPDNWSGVFDFSHKSEAAALQCYFRDATDPDNRAMVGARRADSPESWINLKALDCTLADGVVAGGPVRWADLWAQTDLTYQPTKDKLKAEIVCKKPGHPLVFGFALSLAPGHTVEFSGGGAQILNADGVEVMRLAAPWARDSSTVHPDTLEGQKLIGVTMRKGGPRTIDGRQYWVVELVVNEEDLEGAIYPVVVDPTVQITGTTDIEDTSLYAPGPDNNLGGNAAIYTNDITTLSGIVRVLSVAIPSGIITGFRLIWKFDVAGVFSIKSFFIADANTWVEGSQVYGVETGAACWNYAKYFSQPWAGSVGCSTSGTDYDADASPPTLNVNGPGWYSFILDPLWPPLWRDSTRVNNGFLVGHNSVAEQRTFRSTEAPVDPLYLEIDYSVGSAIAAMSMPRMIQ